MINENIIREIKAYCDANDIDNPEAFINKMVRNGFNIERYGDKPPMFKSNKPDEVVEEVVDTTIDDLKGEIKTRDMEISRLEALNIYLDGQIKKLTLSASTVETIVVKEPVVVTETVVKEVIVKDNQPTTKRYNIKMNLTKPKTPPKEGNSDIYGEQNSRGVWGSNLFGKK